MRGRPRKQLIAGDTSAALAKTENNVFTPEVFELPIIQVSEKERDILNKNVQQVAAIGSKVALLGRKIDKINEELRRDALRQELKSLKKEYKAYLQLQRDASNKLNGILELALREIDGDNIEDKIKNIKALNA